MQTKTREVVAGITGAIVGLVFVAQGIRSSRELSNAQTPSAATQVQATADVWQSIEWALMTGVLTYLWTKSFMSHEFTADHHKLLAELNGNFLDLCSHYGEELRHTARWKRWLDHPLNPADMGTRWTDIIRDVETSIDATCYARIEDQAYPPLGWRLQAALHQSHSASIERVFILDHPAEIDAIPADAKSCGLSIYILRDSVVDLLKFHHIELETLDFGVFDDKLLFLWMLKPDRRLSDKSIVISNRDHRFKTYKKAIRLIKAAAKDADAFAHAHVGPAQPAHA